MDYRRSRPNPPERRRRGTWTKPLGEPRRRPWVRIAVVVGIVASVVALLLLDGPWLRVTAGAVLLGELSWLILDVVFHVLDAGPRRHRLGRRPYPDPPEHSGLPTNNRDLHR